MLFLKLELQMLQHYQTDSQSKAEKSRRTFAIGGTPCRSAPNCKYLKNRRILGLGITSPPNT